MKNALISPTEEVTYISAWELAGNTYVPVYTTIGERVAEVLEQIFEVAPPLFWVECSDNVAAEGFYYDSADSQVKIVPDPAPQPEPVQPTVDGAQTL